MFYLDTVFLNYYLYPLVKLVISSLLHLLSPLRVPLRIGAGSGGPVS